MWQALADNIMHEMKPVVSIEDVSHSTRKQVRKINNLIFGVPVKKKSINQKLFFTAAQLRKVNK